MRAQGRARRWGNARQGNREKGGGRGGGGEWRKVVAYHSYACGVLAVRMMRCRKKKLVFLNSKNRGVWRRRKRREEKKKKEENDKEN